MIVGDTRYTKKEILSLLQITHNENEKYRVRVLLTTNSSILLEGTVACKFIVRTELLGDVDCYRNNGSKTKILSDTWNI